MKGETYIKDCGSFQIVMTFVEKGHFLPWNLDFFKKFMFDFYVFDYLFFLLHLHFLVLQSTQIIFIKSTHLNFMLFSVYLPRSLRDLIIKGFFSQIGMLDFCEGKTNYSLIFLLEYKMFFWK